MQYRARAKPLDDRAQQVEIGERVPAALNEKHRHLQIEKMRRALVRRLACGMEREAQEQKAAH
ncbi:MAG TPA: hypothetical protein VFZ04_14080, partial [Longimicrobiales bacterium]